MRYLLFPFRWADEKVQALVDRCAFRLMEHLRCERRVLTLMLSLLAVASFVPMTAAILAKDGPFLGKAVTAAFLCYGGWSALTLHTAEDRSVHHWRQYILARAMVAAMKLMVISGIVLWAITGAPHAGLTAPTAASLTLGALAILCGIYLQRTPLSRPVAKVEKPASAPTSAPADL